MDEELLQQIDDTIRDFPNEKDRFNPKRKYVLQKLQRNVYAYKNNLIDMMTTLHAMEKELAKEIKSIDRNS